MVIWAIGMDVHKDTCTARILCGEYGKSSKRIDDFIESFDTIVSYLTIFNNSG